MGDFYDLWLLLEEDGASPTGTIADRVIDQILANHQMLSQRELTAKLEYLRKAVRGGYLSRESHKKLNRALDALSLHHDPEVWTVAKNLGLMMGRV